MSYMMKTKRKLIDINNVDNMILSSEWAREKLLNPEKWEHEVTSIIESIKEYGFDPSFLGRTTHRDNNYWCPSAFMVKPMSDGTLNIPRGIHRLMAAKLLGIKAVEAYVQMDCKIDSERIECIINNLNKIAGSSGFSDLFQTWEHEDNKYIGRDDSRAIFEGFNLPDEVWAGRTVLDIASNTGFFGIQSAINGASAVDGFDILPQMNIIANKLSSSYDINAKFVDCEFWDWDWSKKYDIVFCNQAIYHFSTQHRSKCLGTAEDAFEKICSSAKVLLLMYTFVDAPTPIEGEGYYPSEEKLRKDLKAQGFKTIFIEQRIPGSKCHVIASRWEAFKSEEK